jgi:hypothetical protein
MAPGRDQENRKDRKFVSFVANVSSRANRPMHSTQKFLMHAIELRSELFHCRIVAGNFTCLTTVQSYLCGD